MWTNTTREHFARTGLRLPSGLTDAEWAVLESVLTSIRYRYPWLRHIFADGGYAGKKLRSALFKIGK